jgi:hypothetical protein
MRRLVFAIAVLSACGGDDISLDDLLDEARDESCSYYVSCGLIDDLATCRALYDGNLDPDLLAAVDAGKVIYHGDKARECLDGINGDSCDRNSLFNNEAEAACDATFEGTVGAGGQCALDEECKSRDCNIPDCLEACCQGTCVGDAPVLSGIGGACESSSDCSDGYCDFNTSTCAAYKPLGAACTSTGQCEVGGCVNQVCSTLPGPGEACGMTVGSSCADIGYTCSTTSMTCVPYGLTGDPCTSTRDCSIFYTCGTTGTCQLRPRLGEACDPQTTGCIDNSYCEPATNTCTAPKPDNSPCMDDSECVSDNCDFTTNTCVTRPICI